MLPHRIGDEAARRAGQLRSDFAHRMRPGLLREAVAIREATRGDGHPDLIWTLSLSIEAGRLAYPRRGEIP